MGRKKKFRAVAEEAKPPLFEPSAFKAGSKQKVEGEFVKLDKKITHNEEAEYWRVIFEDGTVGGRWLKK